jgi:hypothetical protein
MSGDIAGAMGSLFSSLLGESEKGQEVMAKFNDAFQAVLEALMPIFETLMEAIEPLIPIVTEVLTVLGEAMMPIIEMLIPPLKAIFEALIPLIPLIAKVLTPVIWVFAKAVEIIAKAIGGIAKGLTWIVNKIIDAINWAFGWMGVDISRIGEAEEDDDSIDVDDEKKKAEQIGEERGSEASEDRTSAATQGRLKTSDAGADLVRLLAPLANFNSLLAIQGSIYNVLTDIKNVMLGANMGQVQMAGVGGVTIENINITSTGVNAADIVSDIRLETVRQLAEIQSYNRKRGGRV